MAHCIQGDSRTRDQRWNIGFLISNRQQTDKHRFSLNVVILIFVFSHAMDFYQIMLVI